ncbi:unnamed protein product, partial [marine sediment metagenome]
TISFESNKVFGTPDYPCIISNPPLNIETNIESISLPGQVQACMIDPVNKTVAGFMAPGVQLTGLAANFILSDGATAFVNGEIQESGLTSNDFTSSLIYTILSEDRFESSEWTIGITISSGLEITNKFDGRFNVFPNPTSDVVNIVNLDANQSFDLFVYNIIGEELFRITKTYMPAKIVMSDYPVGIYIFRLSNPNFLELHKVIVK